MTDWESRFAREEELVGGFDVIFSSHVLEHLPDFAFINQLYSQQLNRGGYFIAITPNGSNDFLKADYTAYHQLWGKVHPVLLSDRFVTKNFGDEVIYLDSWHSMQPEMDRDRNSLQNWELVFVLKNSSELFSRYQTDVAGLMFLDASRQRQPTRVTSC